MRRMWTIFVVQLPNLDSNPIPSRQLGCNCHNVSAGLVGGPRLEGVLRRQLDGVCHAPSSFYHRLRAHCQLGAAFLCAELGVTREPRADHAQYLDHWLTVMKADKKATFTAVFPHGATGAGFFLLTDVEEGIRILRARGSTVDNSEGGWKPAELTARTVTSCELSISCPLGPDAGSLGCEASVIPRGTEWTSIRMHGLTPKGREA